LSLIWLLYGDIQQVTDCSFYYLIWKLIALDKVDYEGLCNLS